MNAVAFSLLAVLVATPFYAGSNIDDENYFLIGNADGSDVELNGEISRSSASYESSAAGRYAAGSPAGFSSVGVVVIRDSSGSFCESDLQSGLCIPDPGEADPGEPGEEEDASPSVVDVVTAASVQIERDIARLGVEPARINVALRSFL